MIHYDTSKNLVKVEQLEGQQSAAAKADRRGLIKLKGITCTVQPASNLSLLKPAAAVLVMQRFHVTMSFESQSRISGRQCT